MRLGNPADAPADLPRSAGAWLELAQRARAEHGEGEAPLMRCCGGSCPALHRYSWAELMKRVFGQDVLTCPRCGSRRRWIAAITAAAVRWGEKEQREDRLLGVRRLRGGGGCKGRLDRLSSEWPIRRETDGVASLHRCPSPLLAKPRPKPPSQRPATSPLREPGGCARRFGLPSSVLGRRAPWPGTCVTSASSVATNGRPLFSRYAARFAS